MPTRVYRAAYTAAPPAHAERLTRGGKAMVRWKARGGKWVEGVPLPGGKARVTVTDVWYFSFTGPDGRPSKGHKGFSDKAATEAEARRRQAEADRRAAGLEVPAAAHAGKGLRQHAADYCDYLRAKGRSAHHVGQVEHQLGWVLDRTGAAAAAELTEGAVTVAVAARPGPGAASRRQYLTAVRAWLGWMRREGRAAANPLADLVPPAAGADVRRRRRRLTDPEFERLLGAAGESRPRRAGRANARPHGEARACLYLAAAYTGLRAGELAALRPDSFHLGGDPPFVALPGRESKGKTRAEDLIPLPPALVPRLRAFLAGKPPARPVWPGAWWQKAADMVRDDLAACDPPIPYMDARGRQADFHSLLRLFIGKLADAGVDVKHAQKMARHSTATLTLDVYRDEAELRELAAAAARLSVPAPPGTPPAGVPGAAREFTSGGQASTKPKGGRKRGSA